MNLPPAVSPGAADHQVEAAAAANYARGHYTIGREQIEVMGDRIRKDDGPVHQAPGIPRILPLIGGGRSNLLSH